MSKWFIEEVRYPEVPDFDHIKYEPIENERTYAMSECLDKYSVTEFDKMVEFLDSTYTLKDQLVPCLVGPPGIGKTAAVNKHMENVHAKNLVVIIASQILPNEVSGMTMPDPETKAMEIYDHFRLSSLQDGDILFFDELLEADQLVLSACLTLIESRTLMSGKKLPDIQIVAATNPTIQPTMLKENIRQRFLFRNFELDMKGTRQFILDDCGFDVGPSVVGMLQETGKRYNILTPRSLTKMARWIASAKDDVQARLISRQINAIWSNDLGSYLYNAASKYDPNREARKALKRTVLEKIDFETSVSDVDWENDSMAELVNKLSSLKEWDQIAEKLKDIEIKESESTIDF